LPAKSAHLAGANEDAMTLEQVMDSPFASIWYRPRATIRSIVDSNPRRYVLLLAITTGITAAFAVLAPGRPVAFTIGSHPIAQTSLASWELWGLAKLAGYPLLSIAGLYLTGWLIRWAGGLLGGTATAVEVRAAIAWSMLIQIAANLLYLPFALSGVVRPYEQDAIRSLHDLIAVIQHNIVVTGGIFIVLVVWQFVVMLQCVAEVHRFSFVRALGAYLINLFIFIAVGILTAPLVILLIRRAGAV
jgi:Yip1 domain